tara:strand:+ start:375 stop:656 length:282 start_codon:yes stop_codon:yes gene_type:complete
MKYMNPLSNPGAYGSSEDLLRAFGTSPGLSVSVSRNDPGGSADNENDATVDLTTFQDLLDKLEGSKKRQQRQQSVEGRRDIYAQGLASMMGNF